MDNDSVQSTQWQSDNEMEETTKFIISCNV